MYTEIASLVFSHRQYESVMLLYIHFLGDDAMAADLLGEYCDGRLFNDSDLFQTDPCALQDILYYDEVECCSDNGSKTHKLG
jgi:hypothetical protein